MKRPALALLFGVLVACAQEAPPPVGQLVVWVDTDAPLVREDPLENDLLRNSGLFDRLRIEILAADGTAACDACVRDFVVSQKDLDEGRVSFGVELPQTAGFRVRARLFTSASVRGGEIPPDAAIDGVFVLPLQKADAVTEATVMLPLDSVGQAADPSADAPPAKEGRVLQGLRAIAYERPSCSTDPKTNEVCVPGGVFWAGASIAGAVSAEPWRPVVLSPFFLDAHEVTVAEMRASGLVTAADPARAETTAGCTFTQTAGKSEDLPVTCVSIDFATAYCKARGGALPTIAQAEYVRSRLAGERYVWGFDAPTCEDAIWGRTGDNDNCAALGRGPAPAGSGKRDRLTLPTGEIVDLLGNVSELLADGLAKSCRVPGLERDPFCEATADLHGFTNGSYLSPSTDLLAPSRGLLTTVRAPNIGFRCARPDE